MKTNFVLSTVAAFSMLGMLASAPLASAATATPASPTQSEGGGIGHFDCNGGDTYDVQKGMCIPTTGATAYSPNMHVSESWLKEHPPKAQ